jgi:amino acid adenylation domain-containing protein
MLLHELADRQAQARPEATAIVYAERRMSYAELCTAGDRVAGLLAASGCEPGARVAMIMPKSPEAIVAMHGILKAGCIYVPMDPANPPARLGLVLEASEPAWILAAGDVSGTLKRLLHDRPDPPRIGWLDRVRGETGDIGADFDASDLASALPIRVPIARTTGDPAHILFTSGSTGRPKGVVITHAMVGAFLAWAVPYFGIDQDDRVSGHSPLHFDLSTFDIYGAFAGGAELHLVPAELNLLAPRLADFIRDSRLTQWFSVPSIMSYMARFDALSGRDFPELERVLWCGEVFPTPDLIYWMDHLPHATFTNLYGPTEATIASSYHTLTGPPRMGDEQVPIGLACAGEELLVLDETMRPLPPGEVGDLYIGGAGLSPGYWRDPDKTRDAFRVLPGTPPRRVYRTGDLAHLDQEGVAWFHGRSDSQIKSRGYRIELGEIETALNTLPSVKACAVVAIPAIGFEGSTICCAYVPASGQQATASDLRLQLAKLVPAYMLPARWMDLERLPENANGKVDRPALRARFAEQS